MKKVVLGSKTVGVNNPCYIIAEIGINHNGDVEIAKKLISMAKGAGADAVKFQKRTVDVVYTKEELDKSRESPFGVTNRALKEGLEFGLDEYEEIDRFCRLLGIPWFASCWDEASVDFMEQFNPPCYKIASASLTDDNLLRHIRSKGKPVILGCGMTELHELDHAVEVIGKEDLILLHACSAYPAKPSDLNLRAMTTISERYGVVTGYSGHETNIISSCAAVALGAKVLERHITLDRAMWGSDQAASLGPNGLYKMISYVRCVEESLGNPTIKCQESEIPVMKKLRRVQSQRPQTESSRPFF
ncbi:MAG: N-acetylneuraminate synthase family protein [Oligoflexales bacterium]|nr:N-acetylneuraminate synthase family protein [Oligoflexales bacterium]